MSTAAGNPRTRTSRGWQLAELHDGELRFTVEDGLRHALRDGFFYVRQPAGTDLSAGDRFARSFYLPAEDPTGPGAPRDPYRGFHRWTAEQLGRHQGYFCRDADQTEQFFLKSTWWDQVYPAALARQAERMRDFALAIQRAVLARLDLPRELWDQATGHSLTPHGTHTLTFNHFRPEVAARGLNIHKDSGWVTVLRSTERGLEVDRDGAWHPIDPIPGTFIVNFGCAMEILTRRTATPVAAVAHRVVRQPPSGGAKPDRFSYALFVDSSLDESVCPGLFAYEAGRGLRLHAKFGAFLDDILDNTYREDTSGLY
ncbi:2OG-Fe(II) oxygenase family protein [Streptomyces sp. DSM 44915]|uniref:2OG-Fe(II) oxygenase family protein n=1 Tax=Streptomyces chisholmiae TaxID=3075540 RepID=A0ABU2JRW8_9ACTN|nr:2OG-Fe(II) oxygenase family protein [Streptomyces sp. DSM 44915]MDT0267463.1 2OG-Fe(II) oxygenase family protein [Streptomyces sp. DSM 44915]